MRLRSSLSCCGAVGFLLLASGCPGKQVTKLNGSGTTTGGTGGDAGFCTPDPILLAATTACHLDDQCPCGAHCALGLCAADCQMDSQCPSGDYCDSFGRCRFQSDQGLIGFAPVQQPSVALRPSTLTISVGDTSAHAIELEIDYPGPTDGGAVRLHPDPGLVLVCSLDGGESPDSNGDCLLPADQAGRFGVKLDGSEGDGGVGDAGTMEVHVYVDDQIQTLTINPAVALSSILNAPAVPGSYAGEAQLLGILDQAAGDGGVVAPLSIPLSAEIGTVGGALALQITDPSHTLAPFDSWAAPLTGTPGHYFVTFPTYRALYDLLLPDSTVGPPGADGGADVEVMVQAAPAAVTISGGDAPAISFQLQLSVGGVVANQALVSSTYAVTLGFDPSDGGSALPIALDAGDVGFLDAGIGASPTPWGVAFDETWTALPAAGTAETGPADPVALAVAAGLQDDAGTGGPLDSCLRTPEDFTIMAGEIFSQLFADSPAAVFLDGATTLAQGHTVATGSSELDNGPTLTNPLGIGLLSPFTGASYDWRNSQNPALAATGLAIAQAFGPVGNGDLSLSTTDHMNASYNLPFPELPAGQIACALNSSAGTIQVQIAENCGDFPGIGLLFPSADYCAYNGGVGKLTYSASPEVTVPAVTADQCDRAAEMYGCTPQTLATPVALTGTGNWLPGGAGDSHLAQITFAESTVDLVAGIFEETDTGTWVATYDPTQAGSPQLTVTRVCQLPVNPPDCLQRATCVDPGANEMDDPVAPDLGTKIRSNSGDLVCEGGLRAADFAIDETIAEGDGGASAPTLLATCQQELSAFHATLPPAVTETGAQGLYPLLPSAQCVEGSRWIELLEVAVQEAASEGSLSTYEQGEVHRVFQRWLKLHAFVAREEIEREGMANVYAALQIADPLGPHIPAQADLDLALGGMTLLLHPRFSPLLDQLSGAVLAAPDYRALIDPAVTFPNYTQSEGLPVSILEALDADVELATVGVNELWAASNPPDFTKLAGFEKVLRYVTALRPLAIRLADRAASSNPAWYPEYLQESSSLDARVATLVANLGQVRAGQNFLGIDPSEVPLYFQGTAAGAGGEFSAISDYLLGGYPNDQTAWAPALISQAAMDLGAAQTAYEAQLDRQLELAQLTASVTASETNVQIKYGDAILNLCGAVTDSNGLALSALDILGHAPATLYGTRCFKVHSPSCQITTDQLFAAYTADDICDQICFVSQLKGSAGVSAAKLNDPNLDALAFAGGCSLTGSNTLTKQTGTGTGGNGWDLVTNKQDYAMNASSVGSSISSGVTQDLAASAKSACHLKFPQGVDPLPSPGTVESSILDPGCFQGSLGQEALTLTSIATNVEIARSEYADQMDAYVLAVEGCLNLKQQKGDSDLRQAEQIFADTLVDLRDAKQAVDDISDSAQSLSECANSVGDISDDPTGKSVTQCATALGKAVTQSAGTKLTAVMGEAQDGHDSLVGTLQGTTDEQMCANDASQYIVGQHTQALRIAQAIIDLSVAQNQLQEDEASVQQLLSEGRQALAAVSSGVTVDPAFDFWLSSDIQTFQKDFALAQRTTYLAVRAAEYEFQASLVDSNAANPGTTYTSEVLAAQLPQQLTSVVNSLLEVTGTGQVDGNRPSNLTVIISLRDALFQLADESKVPADKHVLTSGQRFEELLASRKYAMYDSSGSYLGQQIPFSLAPLGAPTFGQTNTQSIPIFAAGSCAERIWSVFAAIEGSDNLFIGSDSTPFAQINLLKSNTFYSQWCSTPSPDGTPFQKSTVNPSINLFEDPEQGAPGQTSAFGIGNADVTYTPARLDAYFNVTATALAQQAYANGQDNELATRGLYGDYAVFLPASELSQPGVAGPSTGLDLNGIDDILLRIDYVSVAKN